jgi:hypothetical protein
VTTNRPTPEGAWDHEIPYHLEDTLAVSADDFTTKPTALLALGLLHNQEKDVQMLKGWRTVAVAVGIAAVGALDQGEGRGEPWHDRWNGHWRGCWKCPRTIGNHYWRGHWSLNR